MWFPVNTLKIQANVSKAWKDGLTCIKKDMYFFGSNHVLLVCLELWSFDTLFVRASVGTTRRKIQSPPFVSNVIHSNMWRGIFNFYFVQTVLWETSMWNVSGTQMFVEILGTLKKKESVHAACSASHDSFTQSASCHDNDLCLAWNIYIFISSYPCFVQAWAGSILER